MLLVPTPVASEAQLPSAWRPVSGNVVEAIAEAGREWSVQTLVDPDGETGLVIMPRSGDDADGPTLVLWETGSALRLDQMQWDSYQTLGVYSVAAALEEIRRRTKIRTASICPT
jgi:hypothetical protein